jgi:hypothetical protein
MYVKRKVGFAYSMMAIVNVAGDVMEDDQVELDT